MSRYALTTDLASLSLPAGALASISSTDQQAALDVASAEADGYLGASFRLPLITWGVDLKQHVCGIAAFRLMHHRGYNPQMGANDTIRQCYDDAIGWLHGVSAGRVTPVVTDSAPAAHSVARVYSKPSRGWDWLP